MPNAKLDKSQAGIKIAGRNIINNLRYLDTTRMAESEEELKSLLMKAKDESEKSGLKLNIQKTKIMESSPITSWKVVVQLRSCVRLSAMDCSTPGLPGPHHLMKFSQVHVHCISEAI